MIICEISSPFATVTVKCYKRSRRSVLSTICDGRARSVTLDATESLRC